MKQSKENSAQWRIQNFPDGDGGVSIPNGKAPTYNFSSKTIRKWKKLDHDGEGGACIPDAPLDPPMMLI